MTEAEKDEKKFNETLKRMLRTPPRPHDKGASQKSAKKPIKTPAKKR